MSSRMIRLNFEIEVARQRLQYAIDSKRDKLAFETQTQLANLHEMLRAETKANSDCSQLNQTYWLVFCDSFQDGRVCSQVEYRALWKRMDTFDRETHVAIEVDGPIESHSAVEQALVLDSTERRNVKKTG